MKAISPVQGIFRRLHPSVLVFVLLLSFGPLAGCSSLRLAPSEKQKQNAWLHNRTALAAAETAQAENASDKLKALTRLSELQSRAFTSYYGLPKQLPEAQTAEEILSQASWQLARSALSDATARPNMWDIADSALGLAIGICALFGGVYGTKAVGLLRSVRTKSRALKEIIAGNELFKKQNPALAEAFKQAHHGQSPQTRKIVAEMKS